mgnify:CR=1 FL=1
MIDTMSFENLKFHYASGESIFAGLTYSFPMDGNFAVRTHGTTGRSTLLKILVGALQPESGNYLINGLSVFNMSFEEFLFYRQKIGYGYDYGGLLSNKTLRENMLLPLHYHNPDWVKDYSARVDELMDVFGLYVNRNARPSEVSGSKRKACCLARAFVMQPEVVLLDEPTQGLTDGGIEVLARLITKSRKDEGLRHVFISSENETLLRLLQCDSLWLGQTEIRMGARPNVGAA